MAQTQLNQQDALRAILRGGRKYTMDQLVELVGRKTRRKVKRASLFVQLSHLRHAKGSKAVKVKTLRGKAVKDGVTRYTA